MLPDDRLDIFDLCSQTEGDPLRLSRPDLFDRGRESDSVETALDIALDSVAALYHFRPLVHDFPFFRFALTLARRFISADRSSAVIEAQAFRPPALPWSLKNCLLIRLANSFTA
jgi:hypothetical protein